MIQRFSLVQLTVVSLFTLMLPLSVETLLADTELRGMNVATSIDADDIDALAALGANVARYQLSVGTDVSDIGPEEFLTRFRVELDNLESALANFAAHDIQVILDYHTPPGGFSSIGSYPKLAIFEESWARDLFVETWDEIAARFAGDSRIVAYEILSEPGTGTPRTNPDWPVLAAEVIESILEIDQERLLIVAPDYANFRKLKRLSKKLRKLLGKEVYKEHVIHNVHIYHPVDYVKQGLDERASGLEYPSKQVKRKELRKYLKKIRRLQRKLRLRSLLIGEFSVVRWAPGAANYLRDLLKFFERYGWDYTYHAFRESSVWSIEHSDDPNDSSVSETETARATVLKQYFSRNE